MSDERKLKEAICPECGFELRRHTIDICCPVSGDTPEPDELRKVAPDPPPPPPPRMYKDGWFGGLVRINGIEDERINTRMNKENQRYGLLHRRGADKKFREWWEENAVDLNESYSKADMEWIAEKAWNDKPLKYQYLYKKPI